MVHFLGIFITLIWSVQCDDMINKLLREHAQRTAKRTLDTTLNSAWDIIQQKHNSTLNSLDFDFHLRRHSPPQLRRGFQGIQIAASPSPSKNTGYSGVDTAKKLLNAMIYEAEQKYELELSGCCKFDKSQSILMEETRQAISLANEKAAEAQKEILASRSGIAVCETQIPKLKIQLRDWINQCEFEVSTLDTMLATVRNDVGVIGDIINVSNCDGLLTDDKMSAFMLYHCSDECGNYQTVGTGTERPMSPRMQALAMKMLAQSGLDSLKNGAVNLTTTSPLPRTITRSRPCKAPRTMDPNSAKCTINRTPQCGPLVEKFSYIMTGLIETQRELEQKREHVIKNCMDTRHTIEAQIDSFEIRLKDYETALAGATATYAAASETSRLKGTQLKKFMYNYKEMTEECHSNYEQLETEICALNKIRGDVFNKLKGESTVPAYFTDCKVSEWVEVDPGCSVSCGGGNLKLQRTIEVYPVGGAQCPDLDMVTTCNEEKCPIDCEVGDWSGWSDCSTKCGGGVQERNRPVKVEAMYGGEACGEVDQVQPCNPQSCDKDCILSDWTAWTNCSKSCNLGHSTRIRKVVEPAIGDGDCADIDGPVRVQKESCNPEPCVSSGKDPIRKCRTKADVMILIDGSASVGVEGWEIQMNATRMMVEAANPQPGGNEVSIIVFSGPQWLCEYYQCIGYTDTIAFKYSCTMKPPEDLDCGVNIVSHFTSDLKELNEKIDAIVYPARRTFTSKALAAVEGELNLGQKDAESVVIVLTDGIPEDKKSTAAAAHRLNQRAKVIWVPITANAPLDDIKSWATDPENVIPVKEFIDLDVNVVNDITATACRELKPIDLWSDVVH